MSLARGTSSFARLCRVLARRPWLVWGISIALHGVLLGAVYELVWRPRFKHPEIEFARGDGSAEGGMVRDWSIVAQTPSLPASIATEANTRTLDRPISNAVESNDGAANFAQSTLPQLNSDDQSASTGFGVAKDSGAVKLAAVKAPWSASNHSQANPSAGQSSTGSDETHAPGSAASHSNGGNGPGIPTGALNRALPTPVYPEESRLRREQGVVKLAVEILPDGSVGQITVISDPGYPRLVQAAVDSVRKAKRLPVWQENGVAVKWVAHIPFDFHLRS